jgi:hypothetical protein
MNHLYPPEQMVRLMPSRFSFLTVVCALAFIGCGSSSQPTGGPDSTNAPSTSPTGFMANTPDENARQVMDQVMSTPQGRATATRLADKDDQLTAFQQSNGISERIAEAAIKEWVMTHGRDFDWNLEDVKAICLRNKASGIPRAYLPEAEKR